MIPKSEKIRERYDREAAGTDHLGCGLPLLGLELSPGQIVLDLGCGRGEETLAAAAQVRPEGTAIGIDLSAAMIEAAKSNARQKGFDNVLFLQADMTQLPLPADSVDVVFSNCAINHAVDKVAVYREIGRVLRPGGLLSVSDVVSLIDLPAEIRQDPEAWADCFGGAIREDRYLAAIRSAGLEMITIISRREYSKRGYPLASLTIRARKPMNQEEV